MKILLVNDMGSEVGGAETMIMVLKKGLEARGHTVRILAGNHSRGTKFSDYEFKSFDDHSVLRYLLFIYNPFAALTLKKVLREFRPDVVHLHNTQRASASILFLLKNHPTVMTAHDFGCIDQTIFNRLTVLHPYKEAFTGYFIYTKSVAYWVQKLRFKLIRRAQRHIDLFIAPSKAIQKVLTQAGIKNKSKVIYNGVIRGERTGQKVNRSSENVLFVGRVVRNKGIYQLVQAMNYVLEQNPRARLVIAGNGPDFNAIQDLCKTEDLCESVTLLGSVRHQEITKLYQRSAVVVVPSLHYEPLGLVAIEAIAEGCPVVASAAGGLMEIVTEGVNGKLCKSGNAEGLADAILAVLNDQKLRQKVANNGIKTVEKFSVENYIDQTLSVYTNVISRYHS